MAVLFVKVRVQMQQSAVQKVEQEISHLAPEEQKELLGDLPHLLKISPEDLLLLKVAEKSFEFWNNQEDSAYDRL